MTNSIEALLIMLATGSIGAIFSSTAPDMGTKGIVERFAQIQPKILFVESEVLYGGKTRDLRSKLKEAVHKLSQQVTTISNIVLITGHAWIGSIRAITLSDFLNVPIQPLEFVQLPFDHPMYIVYSSGTTGPPKCIVHSAGGSLLKHKQDMSLMMDLGIDSTYYQYTTTGWMMWNVLVGGLSTGARVILYDGNPLHPSPSAQLRFIEEQGVTHWGTSPKFLATLKHDLDGFLPPKLDALQVTLVAGSPLSLGLCDWFYSTFPKHVALNNGSGGTDVLGCIIGGNSLMPVYGIELAGPALGMDVQVWDAAGRNIAATGDKGELVIVTPFPSMPVSFWGENGVEEYRKAYFDRYPGIWCHGDFVSMNPKTGGYLIHGRSDGVLNPGGMLHLFGLS
jgi:acetoacetyl-CoA synthetase